MFGSDIWNAGASLRQYPDSATGVPAPAASPFWPMKPTAKNISKKP
jgi:hypothetical protein